MSRGVNKVILVGNLGQDPEVKEVSGDRKVASVTLATNESYKDRDGNKVDKVEWHRLVLWGTLAELAGKYMKKGSQVYVEGKLQTRSWEDEAGVKRFITEVQVREMRFLDSKEGGGGGTRSPEHTAEDAPPSEPTDDLPF